MGKKKRTSLKTQISDNILLLNTKKKIKSSRIQIPDDILFNVLKILPAKSIMRFKCVCKTWQTLITDPYFAQLHFEHSQTRLDASCVLFYLLKHRLTRSIFPTSLEAVITSGLPTHKFHETLPCTNIVNGLICLSNQITIFEFILLNLTTGEKVNLPCESYFWRASICLGFDPRGKEYKVVAFPGNSKEQTAKCVILTLGTNTGRSIPCDPRLGMHKKGAICVSGRIYWKDMLNIDGQSVIQYFSVRKEKFGVLVTPYRGRKVVHLTQIGKNIAIACRRNYNPHSLRLWIFNHENKDWIKNEIKLGSIPISNLEILGSTGKTGEILMTAKSRPDGILQLIFYDLGTATFRISKITYPGMPQGAASDLICYVASAAASNHVENILPLTPFKVKEGKE